MILGRDQSKRFQKLFNLLMFHVRDTDEGKAALAGIDMRTRNVDADVMDALLSLVWGPDGGTEMLDAYVNQNPDGLSRTDLREVASWKDGVYDSFVVVRRGNDVVFVYGEYALAVRGITREVDQQVKVPSTVKTVLVPFDGLITYGTVLSRLHVEVTPAMERAFYEDARHAIDEHGLVRSQRQYLKVLPEARANAERMRAEQRDMEADGGGLTPAGNAGDENKRVVRGALAGLTWEERQEAIDAYVAEHSAERYANMREVIDPICSKGLPAPSLVASFRRLTKKELQEIANGVHDEVHGNISGMSKDQLVRALSELVPVWAEKLATHAVGSGVTAVESLKQLVDAGGEMLVPFEGDLLFCMPNPVEPLLEIHRTSEGYLVWLAPELARELSGIDWEERLVQARALDEVFGRIEHTLELRGVVARSEVLGEVPVSLDDKVFEDALSTRLEFGDFGEVNVSGEGAFFIHQSIDERLERTGATAEVRERIIQSIIGGQKGYPPRDERTLDGYDSVLALVETYASYRNLVAYLDEHVPEGEDGYTFADYVAGDVVDTARAIMDVRQARELVEGSQSITATNEQFTNLAELMMALVNDVPRWSLNGWSPNEAAALRA